MIALRHNQVDVAPTEHAANKISLKFESIIFLHFFDHTKQDVPKYASRLLAKNVHL